MNSLLCLRICPSAFVGYQDISPPAHFRGRRHVAKHLVSLVVFTAKIAFVLPDEACCVLAARQRASIFCK